MRLRAPSVLVVIFVLISPALVLGQGTPKPCECKNPPWDPPCPGVTACDEGYYGTCRCNTSKECAGKCRVQPKRALALAADVIEVVIDKPVSEDDLFLERKKYSEMLGQLLSNEGRWARKVCFGFSDKALELLAEAKQKLDEDSSASINPSAQCPYGGMLVPVLQNHPFKIKAVSGVSSSTARDADYVEFKTMENIYSATNPAKLLFAKDTPIFAVVTRRKHRHFPFVGGHLELELKPLVNWDGKLVEIAIARHGPINTARAESKKERNRRNKPCKEDRENCVAGRRNASVAPLVPAVAAAGAGTIAALAKEEETRFIAATAFFSIAKEVGNLLNGTDAEISKDEIFDMYVKKGSSVCELPKDEKKQ